MVAGRSLIARPTTPFDTTIAGVVEQQRRPVRLSLTPD
jgi:hypothetical protein